MPRHELLNLFPTEEDRTGRNIQAMSDFFPILVEFTRERKETPSAWEIVPNASMIVGEIKEAVEKVAPSVGAAASAINLVQAVSKMDEYVVDMSNLPSRVLEGLGKVYHFGDSHKILGNKAPTIYGNGEVIQVTLKKAVDPSLALSNVAALSMQIALHEISSSLRNIQKGIDDLKKNARDEKTFEPFFTARKYILRAAEAETHKERERLLHKADTHLMNIISWLEGDIKKQLTKLGEYDGIFNMSVKGSKPVDDLLSLIIREDMQLMHRCIALLSYLLNYRGEEGQAVYVLDEYRLFLRSLQQDKEYGKHKQRTAFELIHTEYPYTEGTTDLWIEWPKQMVSAIDSYSTLLKLKGKEVIRIGVEQ